MNYEILKKLYFAFVFPHLLYGIEIYGNTYQSHLSKLVKLNNEILNTIKSSKMTDYLINQSINESVSQSVSQSVNQSINLYFRH